MQEFSVRRASRRGWGSVDRLSFTLVASRADHSANAAPIFALTCRQGHRMLEVGQ